MPTTSTDPIIVGGATPAAIPLGAATPAVSGGATVTTNPGAGTISINLTGNGSNIREGELRSGVSPINLHQAQRYVIDSSAFTGNPSQLGIQLILSRKDGSMLLSASVDAVSGDATLSSVVGAKVLSDSIAIGLNTPLQNGTQLAVEYTNNIFALYTRLPGETQDTIRTFFSIPDAARDSITADPGLWEWRVKAFMISGTTGSVSLSGWSTGETAYDGVTRSLKDILLSVSKYRSIIGPEIPIGLTPITYNAGTLNLTGGATNTDNAGASKRVFTLPSGGAVLWNTAASPLSCSPSFGLEITDISSEGGDLFLEIGMRKDDTNFVRTTVRLTASSASAAGGLAGTFGTVAPAGLSSTRGAETDFGSWFVANGASSFVGSRIWFTLTNANWITLWIARPGDDNGTVINSWKLPVSNYDPAQGGNLDAPSTLFDAALRDPAELALWKFTVGIVKVGNGAATLGFRNLRHSAGSAVGERDQNWVLVKDAANPSQNNQVYIKRRSDGNLWALTSGEFCLPNDQAHYDNGDFGFLFAIRSVLPAMFWVPLEGPNGLWAAWLDRTRQTTVNYEVASILQFDRTEKQGTGVTVRRFPDNDGCVLWDVDRQKWCIATVTFGDYVQGRSKIILYETSEDITLPSVHNMSLGSLKTTVGNEYDIIIYYDVAAGKWKALSTRTQLDTPPFNQYTALSEATDFLGPWAETQASSVFAPNEAIEGTKVSFLNGDRTLSASCKKFSLEATFVTLNPANLSLSGRLPGGHYRSKPQLTLAPHAPLYALPAPDMDGTIVAGLGYNYAVVERFDGSSIAFASCLDSCFYLGQTRQPADEFAWAVQGEGPEPEQVVTPTFAPPAGQVASGTEITATSTTPGVTIRYTTNGADPTEASTTTKPVVTAGVTVKARGYKEGFTPSAVATAAYTVTVVSPGDTTPPTFVSSVINASGTTLTLTFSESVTGVSASAFTLSGGATLSAVSGSGATRTLTISPPVYVDQIRTLSYSGAGTVDGAGNALAAFSGAAVINNSTQAVPVTPGTVAIPLFLPVAGSFNLPQSVTITTTTAGAAIYYTTNGSAPTAASTLYTAPVTVPLGTTTLRAIAVKAGSTDSAIRTGTYIIGDSIGPGNGGSGTITAPTAIQNAEALMNSEVYPGTGITVRSFYQNQWALFFGDQSGRGTSVERFKNPDGDEQVRADIDNQARTRRVTTES